MTTICDLNPVIAQALSSAVGESHVVTSLEALRQRLETDPAEDTVVLGPTVDQTAAFRVAEQLRIWRPALGVILVRSRVDTGLLAEAMRAGVRDVVGERNIAGLH
jgi:pilus assembly protein CpaE